MKYLKCIGMIFCLLTTWGVQAQAYIYPYDYLTSLKDRVAPENTVFAFDLHDVLFTKNYKKMTWDVFKMLFKGLGWYTLNPFFWQDAMYVASQDLIWEDIYYKLAEQYPGMRSFERDFFEMSNSCRPIKPMVDFLCKLKERGFKLFLLSNIGYATLQDFNLKFKDIMDNFDGFFTPSKDNNYIHKPNPEFYEAFKLYLMERGHGEKQVIFVDDLIENIESAHNCGLAGFHFTYHSKFVEDLKRIEINLVD